MPHLLLLPQNKVFMGTSHLFLECCIALELWKIQVKWWYPSFSRDWESPVCQAVHNSELNSTGCSLPTWRLKMFLTSVLHFIISTRQYFLSIWCTTVIIFNIVQLTYLFDLIYFLPISLDFTEGLTQIQRCSFLKSPLTLFLNLVSPWPSEYVLLYLLRYVAASSVRWFASTFGNWLISFLSLLVSFSPSFHFSCPDPLDSLHEWSLYIADWSGWCWAEDQAAIMAFL